MRGSGSYSGNLSSSQRLTVRGIQNLSTTLTAASGFTNNTTISLDSTGNGSARLTVTNGTLVNNGTINLNKGGTQPLRTLSANLINNGTVNVNTSNTKFSKTDGVTTNNGGFNIAADAALSFGTRAVFNQNAGTLSILSSFPMVSDTFNFNGGTLSGNDPVLNGSTLNIATTGVGRFVLLGSTTYSGNLAATQRLFIRGVPNLSTTLTSAEGFINDSTIDLESTGNGFARLTVTNGTLVNNATINLLAGGTNQERNLRGDLINNGTINITTVDAQFDETDAVATNNNALNVAAGANLTFGTRSVFNQNAGVLDNQGSFAMVSDTFNFNGGTLSGNDPVLNGSTLNIATTGVGRFVLLGSTTYSGNLASTQKLFVRGVPNLSTTLAAADGFTNDGTIDLESTGNGFARLTVTNGALVNNGTINLLSGGTTQLRSLQANLINNGTVNITTNDARFDRTDGVATNNNAFNIESGANLTFGTRSVFNQDAGVLDNQGSFTMVGDTFNFNGGAITGNDPVLNASTLNNATTSAAQFVMLGNSSYSGNLASTQGLIIRGVSGLSATLTSANGFINNGTIILDSTGNGFAKLTVTNGTLINNATINLDQGGSQPLRVLDAELANFGVINANTSNTRLTKTGANHVNSGVLKINNAKLTVTGNNLTNDSSGFIAGQGEMDLGGLSSFTNDGKLSVKILLLPLPPPPPSFPPAGTDSFLSVAVFEIEVPGVLRILTPALFDFRTVIGRSGQLIEDDPDPETIEELCSELDLPLEQQCVLVDFPEDFGGVGRREVVTEIRSLELKDRIGAGFSVRAGQPALDFLTQLGAPQLFTPSLGEVEALNAEPDSPFPADSFFNVYAIVETPFGPLFNKEPLVVVSREIKGFPPVAFYPHKSKQETAVPFFSLADPFGPPVAFLKAAVHGTRLDEKVGVPIDDPQFEGLLFSEIIPALPPADPLPTAPPLDTVPPTTTKVATPASNVAGWNNTDVTLTFTAIDAAGPLETPSGVESITVEVDGVPQTCPPGPSCTVVLGAEGIFTVDFFATDSAGNAEAPQSQVHKIDKTPPTPVHAGPFTLDEGDVISLDGTASTDDRSGVQSTAWDTDEDGIFDDGDPAVFNGTDGPSTHDVSLRVIDVAGNVTKDPTVVNVRNVAPTVAVVSFTVTIDEGQSVFNSGTFSDLGDDVVSITASVGTVTQVGAQSGSWSWQFDSSDGPDDGQTVIVTATDSDGDFTTISFDLEVDNVAPTATFNAPTAVDEGDAVSLSLTDPFDPSSDDTAAGFSYAFDCGDGGGFGAFGASNSTSRLLKNPQARSGLSSGQRKALLA